MKSLIGFLAVAVFVIGAWGCGSDDAAKPIVDATGTTAPTDESHDEHAHAEADYCGSCGNAAGGDECCVEGAEKCESCGLAKGATLCCKLENAAEYAGKALCGKCGEVKGDEKCCADGAEVCDKCGLHTGSALCCKLPKE